MERLIFGAPMRYVQGQGVLHALTDYIDPKIQDVIVIADNFVLTMLGDTLTSLFAQKGLRLRLQPFNGFITQPHLAALFEQLKSERFDLVLGVGGGVSIDVGKAVAHQFHLPFISVPTVASNDAPTSVNYVVYNDQHQIDYVGRLPQSPQAVIVDTTLIAKAPKHFLLAGIGDAISKKFEAEMCFQSGGHNVFQSRSSLSALAIADRCFDVILQCSAPALAVAGSGKPNDDFEYLVEATILMSGLGFESGGLSIAHALTRGFSAVEGPNHAMHGIQVAYGLLVQLALSEQWETVEELKKFYQQIGLPISLSGLGLSHPTSEDLQLIAERTLTAPHCRHFTKALSVNDFIDVFQQLA